MLVVVSQISRLPLKDPQRSVGEISALLWIASSKDQEVLDRIVVDFPFEHLVATFQAVWCELIKVPRFLDCHPPSLQAVVSLLWRFHEGRPIAVPVDLSEEIRRLP